MRWRKAMLLLFMMTLVAKAFTADYDVIIRNGTVYDGTGAPPFVADVALSGDRIRVIGELSTFTAHTELDASNMAVAPGFFNLLSHSHVSLLQDGRAVSDVVQGITFEVLSETSFSPLTPSSAAYLEKAYGLEGGAITWSTVDDYLNQVEAAGVIPNFATFVSAATVRMNAIGLDDVAPNESQLLEMKRQVDRAMRDGALGLTTALIYAPGNYATTEELIKLAKVASRHGGIYTAHIRSEGNRLLEAVDETVRIGREADIPVKIHHLKAAGRPNWNKLSEVFSRVESYQQEGGRITADMYAYVAGATGLDASMPTWVQAGGYARWVERLQDPDTRARVKSEMARNSNDWENLGYFAGPDGMLLIGFRSQSLRKYTGMTLADVAADRGQDPLDTIIDLVIEDGSRVDTIYFLMSEDNVRRQISKSWMMFGSDYHAPALEGKALEESTHPRAYGNVARVLGKYVRDEGLLSLEQAIHRLTLLPASVLSVERRGRLSPGYYADLVIFDPRTINDPATFENPHQYSTGMQHIFVNGVPVMLEGTLTSARPGRAIRGPGWQAPVVVP